MSDDELTPRGDYGVDAPYAPILMALGGLALVGLGAVVGRVGPFIGGGSLLACAASYLYTTRVGKLAVWTELLRALPLADDARVLDLGCGRGAVLLLAAKLARRGRVTGIDLWSRTDQSGNSVEVTRANAEREGVAERVELHTGDLRQLPFPDGAFDVVVSSLAIHNIPDADGRAAAVREAMRVCRPGGTILLADIRAAGDYARTLRELGAADVTARGLGWRFWYGGPWAATRLVSARKPNVAA